MEYMREPLLRDFRKLNVYNQAMQWAGEIREIVKVWKWEYRQEMGNQLLRSSSSVCANLVEGNSQLYLQREIHFFNISIGSAGESQMWLQTAQATGLITKEVFARLDDQAVEIRKMTIALIKKIQAEIAGQKSA